jgi:hypothetical protein
MRRKNIQLLVGIISLAFLATACRFSIPAQAPSENILATSVAATFTAMTPEEKSTTVNPPTATEVATTQAPAPATVSFVSSARNLYVWREGMTAPSQLTSSGDVDQSYVSPDGSLIAFVRSSEYINYQLDLIHADGSGLTTLISTADFAALPRSPESEASVPYQVVWNPNFQVIYMNVRIQYMGPGLAIAPELYQINAVTGERTVKLSISGNWRFGISPDGSLITISHPTAVDLYSIDGSLVKANVITHEGINTASEYEWTASPDWQADSSHFSVAIPPREPFADSPEVSKLYRVTRSGDSTLMFSSEMSFAPAQISSFNHSLTRVAYATRLQPAADNVWALFISNLDGSSATQIAKGYFSRLPEWPPMTSITFSPT